MDDYKIAWATEIPMVILLCLVGYYWGVTVPVTLFIAMVVSYIVVGMRDSSKIDEKESGNAEPSIDQKKISRATPFIYWTTVFVSCGLLLLAWILEGR